MERCERNSNIEVIKLVAILMIIISHSVPYVDNYSHPYLIDLRYSSESVQQVVMIMLRNLGQIGNLIFMISSFWFLQNSKRVNISKVINIILDTIVVSAFYILVARILGIQIDPWDFRMMKHPISLAAWWFVTCYLIVYIVHPALNQAFQILSGKVMILSIVIAVYAISIHTLWWRSSFYYSSLIGLIYIYFIVSVTHYAVKRIRESCDTNTLRKYKRTVSWLVPFGIFLHIAFLTLFNYVGLHFERLGNDMLRFNIIINPIFIIVAMSVFLIVLFREPRRIRVINYLSSLSLLIYLFHNSILIYKYIVPDIYFKWVFEHINGDILLPLVFLLAFLLLVWGLLLSLIYDKSLRRITVGVSNRVGTVIERWVYS